MKFADVIVPLSIAGTFTYSIPKHLLDECQIGKRVLVQFGRKKYYTAIVCNIHDQKPEYQTKDIFSVIDTKPVISSLHLKFWNWIAEYYMCTLGDVYTAAMPISLRIESQTQIFLQKDIIEQKLSANEQKIIEQLKTQKTLTTSQISKIIDVKNPINIVNKLINKGIVDIYEHFKANYKPKYQKLVKLSPLIENQADLQQAFEKLARAKKQTDILLSFSSLSKLKFINNKFIFNEVIKKELLQKANANSQALKALYEKNILIEYEKQISRLENFSQKTVSFNALSSIQQTALEQIKDNFEKKNVCLLYGITSSGKTEIYIQLIRKYINQGKQILYLLPEIALTSQIIERLRSAFGNIVGIYHSKFNDSERAEIWNKINPDSKKILPYQIILGVRSAIFLPFNNLGLIIVDEEHENTYKQFDPAPRYHARDAAIILANMHKAKVLLGTATPSIESFFNAKNNKYGLVELSKRHKDIELPEITLANIRQARKEKKMKSVFHPLLIKNINEALSNGEQIILFQNRRGFSPYLECRTCGWIPKCKHCDVSMTYHMDSNDMVCHYCGYKTPVPSKCENCGDIAMETRGFGTQKIEDEIHIFFPEVKVARLDIDVARKKHGYEKTLAEFDAGNTDILVGTQMITKGLDFENVRLVGILDADNLLNFPDFRSFERSFQLMTQVSGRAGRMHDRGKVIIQTTMSNNKILKFIIENNYKQFFDEEIIERKEFNYPPFTRLIKISFKHKKEDIANNFAEIYAAMIRKKFAKTLQGPYNPIIKRIQNYYIKEILLKLNSDISLPKAKKLLAFTSEQLRQQKNFSNVIVIFNVDPF